MAQLNLDFDASELASSANITIHGIRTLRIRMFISRVLLGLASWVAPFRIEVSRDVNDPWLFYCQFCGREFNDFYVPGRPIFTVQCPHCNRQNLASSGAKRAWTIAKEDIAPCDYECGFAEPYGFVPEDGCPVHDGYSR